MDDATYMRRAISLAERGQGLVSPNPLVGAVVVSASGDVLGEGWHEGPGTPHAEAMAIAAAGDASRAGTLFTTLEPCNHFGRTPPCTQAILDGGLSRVVVAIEDPNPLVEGGGIRRLREAGVEVSTGVCAEEAADQARAFLMHVRTGRPYVTLKLASTLDGKIAAKDGSSTWITSDAAREDVQRLRAASDAIMVGSGTVLADNPHLTARDPSYRGAPVLRVVVDATGRVEPAGNLFDGAAPTLIATTDRAPETRQDAWSAAGAEVLVCDPDPEGGVSLADVFARLGKRDIQSVLLEGGATLAERAVRGGHVHQLVAFFAPKLLGGSAAPSMLGGVGADSLADAAAVVITSAEMIGPDLKVVADVQRDR